MRIPIVSPRLAVVISLLAWAVLFVRQFLHLGVLQPVHPLVPAAVSALCLFALARLDISRRVKAPLVVAALLAVVAGVALTGIENENPSVQKKWRERETRDATTVLDAVGKRIENLLDLSTTIGTRAGAILRDSPALASGDTVGVRLTAFQALSSLSDEITKRELLPSGTEIGIQLFDAGGKRLAWAGWPQFLEARDRRFVASGKELIYSREVSLYRMLTHIVPVYTSGAENASATSTSGALGGESAPGASRGGSESSSGSSASIRLGAVLIDMPLEVNYKVNNRFLKSAGLADDIARRAAADIRFEFFPVDPELPAAVAAERGRVALERMGETAGTETTGLSSRAVVRSPLGNTLFHMTVLGRPLQYSLGKHNDGVSLIANLAILLALLIYVGVLLRDFPERLSGPAHVVKVACLVATFTLVRYVLIWFEPELVTTKIKVFEPAVFATPILAGLMRSAGDLLITSLFFVAAIYGVLKVSRGAGPAKTRRRARFVGALVTAKGLAAAALSIAVFFVARSFVGSVVANANPRLVGETVKILAPEVIVLHLSVFLMVAGIFLAGMIGVRAVYRMGGEHGATRATAIGAAAIIAVSAFLVRPDIAGVALSALLFAAIAPRFIQREDLVSIVIGAFCFVIIVSASAYIFFNREYQELRRTFIREKTVEVTHPSDNWKVFILEDILENFSREFSIRQTLASPVSSSVQRLAFDLWAASPLSLLGYSCSIHVFDEADSVVSRFAVEMPYRLRTDESGERLETPSSQEWVVLDLTTETPQGAVRFYRGIVNLEDYRIAADGRTVRVPIGKIVVDIPFFFENLAWAARTGPQTPEVLRNVQEGGIAPRLEETEPILLARVKDTRVLESSAEVLPVGYTFDAQSLEKAARLEWPLLKTSGATYRFLSQEAGEPGISLVAGFPVPTPLQHVLRWSAILSLYFFFTVGLIVGIIVLKSVPLVSTVLPTLTPGRQLGFQQKLLASFLLVALLPAVILGVFSVRMIRERFVQENRNEALYRAFSASKAVNNMLLDELHTLVTHYSIGDLIGGKLPPRWQGDARKRVGAGVQQASAELPDAGDRVPAEQVFVHYVDGTPWLEVRSEPFPVVTHGKKETYVVYHARLVDAELLGEVSDQVGSDVNIFDAGELVATSREGLLSGGFISSMMNADAFVKVSMMGVDHSISTEKAGRYRYQVAYVPIPSLDPRGNAAIGVPLLFRPESYSVEVDKARSVVLSIFALLSAATIGLGLLLARGIFEPLKALLEGTKRIARGDFSFELPGKRKDEIGTVAEAFNEMTQQLSRSQAALEERRRYLEVILMNIGTGVISTDETHSISAVNSAAERILGMRSGDLVGKKAEDLAGSGFLPDFFACLARDVEPELDNGSSEVDIVKDGQKRTIKYMRTRLSTDGRPLGAVFVFEDLTDLINSKKLSAWVEMARQIAHEIKNPLTPIKLSTQFMVRAHQERSGDFDRIFRESSETIMQQVDVLRNIASEFSSFGRLQQLRLSPHNVTPLVEDIVSPYRRNTAGVDVSLDSSSPALRAVIDPEAVRKICTNLVENAMEAMAGGGNLRIAVDETVRGDRRMIRVRFRDSGPGLSDEVKGRLFEPYFSTKTTGTGLGLAICRSLSREMGGEVTVENVPGGGGVEATLYLRPA